MVNSHLSSPVLLLGILIGNKRYHCSKFFNVLLIVAGVSLFMFTEVRGEGRGGGKMLTMSCINMTFTIVCIIW